MIIHWLINCVLITVAAQWENAIKTYFKSSVADNTTNAAKLTVQKECNDWVKKCMEQEVLGCQTER